MSWHSGKSPDTLSMLAIQRALEKVARYMPAGITWRSTKGSEDAGL
jgi:hypothetical protein